MGKVIRVSGAMESVTPKGPVFELDPEVYELIGTDFVEVINLGREYIMLVCEDGKALGKPMNDLASEVFRAFVVTGPPTKGLPYIVGDVLLCKRSEFFGPDDTVRPPNDPVKTLIVKNAMGRFIHRYSVHLDEDGTVWARMMPKCSSCGMFYVIQAPESEFKAWESGQFIQQALVRLSVNERDMLISCICPNCLGLKDGQITPLEGQI